MQQASSSDREAYAELLKYGSSVITHLASIRGRPVVPLARSKLLGTHDARCITDSLRGFHSGEKSKVEDPSIHYIFHRSPPCNVPLDELSKIYITDLKWSEVHRGHVLVLRSISTPRKEGSAVVLVVEDECGSAIILRLFNFPISPVNQTGYLLSLDVLLSPKTTIAIKQPYCEAASEAASGLRVDHPSDIIFLDEGCSLFPTRWKRTFDDGETPAEVLKEEGNIAFKGGEYDVAVLRYTNALAHSSSPSLSSALLLNRAQANLQLGKWIPAYRDCAALLSLPLSPYSLSSLSPQPTATPATDLPPKDVEKALYRAARALSALHIFSSALPILEELLKLVPSNRDARTLLDKSNQRLREEKEGKFNWALLLKEGQGSAPRVDVADYVGPVEQSSVDNGKETRCWRAARDIKPGELLLTSKALAVLYPSDLLPHGESGGKRGMVFDATRALLGGSEGWEMTRRIAGYVSAHPNGKKTKIVASISKNISVYEKRLGEEVWEDTGDESLKVIDEQAVIDMNILDSVRTMHTLPFTPLPPLLSSPSQQSTGLTFNPATTLPYLSHSCLPNAALSYIADLCIVRAAQPIARGEAVTVARIFPGVPLDERWAKLEKMGASGERKCSCRLCEIEKEEGDGPRSRRVELVQKVKALAERAPSENLRTDPLAKSLSNRPTEADVLEITKDVEKIVNNLDATYAHPAREQPRFALLEPLAYLFACYLYLGQEYTEHAVKANARYISALGWEVDYSASLDTSMPKGKQKDDGPDFRVTFYGLPHPPMVRALVQQSSVFWQLGKRRTAASWKREAEKLAEVVDGWKGVFKEAFGGVYKGLGWEV